MEITSKSKWNTWKDIDWKTVESKVFKLQKRIFRASLQESLISVNGQKEKVSTPQIKAHPKVEQVRCEAHSGNAQGEQKLPRDSTFPTVLRLTQQAGDNE